MLQEKFVTKSQKHILSFSKVLCAPSGEWLLPLHIFSLVTKKQFKFSNNFALELPPTFCVLNQQPFLLFVKILCALSTGTYSTSSKTLQAVPSLPSHLQRYVWQYFFNTCPKDLRVTCPDAANEAWRGSWVKQIVEAKENEKQRNFFVPPWNNCFQPIPCTRTDSPEKPRHLKFWASIFYLSSLPQLVGLFYKRPQRRTNSVWRTLLNKTVRLGTGFCSTRMIEQRLLSREWVRIERLISVKSWCLSDCFTS